MEIKKYPFRGIEINYYNDLITANNGSQLASGY